MGAESSAQRDGKSQEDASASASASAGELSAEVNVLQEGSSALDSKPLQKNGQISSLTSLNGNSEDNTLAEVGQPDGVSVAQKEETPETMDTIQDEVAPQVNGEKVEKESPDDNDISAVEEKAAEEKPDDASEVGFKKIFRFVGFKFTLKKDKSEEKDPVKLLTVKDKEEVSGADEPTKEAEAATAEEKSTAEEKEADTEASTEAEAEVIKDSEKAETTDAPAEGTAAEATDEAVKEEGAEKEGETTPPSQESTMSPFRKLFSGGLFSNLRKKASVKKTKEEEDKEAAVEEKTAKTEEIAAAVEEKEEKDEVEQETKEAAPATPEEEKTEPKEAAPATPEEEKTEPKEAAPATPEEEKTEPKEVSPATSEEEKTEPKEVAPATSEEEKTEPKEAAAATSEEEKTELKEAAAATSEEEKTEPKEEAPATPEEEKTEPKEEAPATPEEVKSENTPEPEVTVETSAPAATTTDETKQEEEKAEPSAEEEKAPAEVTSEAELLSSQEKVKPQGSPLKKLFAGAGLKKLSSKKQKTKKDAETKLTESGEQSAEQLQSSTESAEAPKADSGPSSPEESGEHVIAVEVTQNESSQETEGEVASDGEKKKEGIIAWSSFKKLVTPKKRVKRSSESEDEATGEKPAKSATLSSSESAALADKSVEEEAKEDKPTEEEPKTENTEKLVSSTEEPKKKMDTSVSWEALMCMGGPKKRTRRTSDSDDEETKVEEEPAAAVEGEQEGKTEAAIVTSLTTESEGEGFSSPDPLSSPPERESAWDTLKRMVMSKNKAKLEEKLEESGEHVQSDSEASKDESSFSLRKFLPGRRKKKAEKQASTEQGSGEEDSDTPAVVPLSEYDEQVESEQEAPQEPAVVQIKVSAEDRSPSWIPAVVEDIDDKHDELSDIPEEAENPATPKSVDTDIAEDETEEEEAALPPKALGRTGRRLSTAEVKPVAPAPAAETTPVPQGPKPESAAEVIGSIETQISEIALKTSVAVEDVPIEVASEKTEFEPETVIAESKTVTTLAPHAGDEAMAICTGLGTKEIAKVALEKPAMPVIECVAVIRDALSTEVLKEEKPTCPEEATAAKDEAFKAQVHQVETTELELAVETCKMDIEAASETVEPESEKVGIVSTVPEESEVIQPTTMNDNSPKTVVVNPITPTSETAVCAQSVEVTEPTVEAKEVKMDMELRAAIEENTEVVQDVNEESITMATEPVVVPSEEVPVITEAVVLVAPVSAEPDQVETPDVVTVENASLSEPVVENASLSEPVADEPVQMQETKEEGTVVETVEATVAQTAESEISEVIEQTSEKMEEIKEDEQQASEFEAQSMVIAQAVIQDAMDKVSEDAPEPKKPTTPTATMPEPVQAVATKEKEMEIATETPVITDAPATVLCEKPAPKPLCVAVEVIDTIPVEVTESLDASVEEEKKPEEGLKEAVEVKVSEETVTVEEVVEIKAESQVEEEQSKEDTEVQEPDVKEAAEEVKPQPEEAKSDAPSEENKEKTLEIHMPVQVVLQTAQVIEEPTVEEEAVVEFDNNGPVAEDEKAASAESGNKLSTLSEEPQETDSAEISAPSQVTEAAASQPETEKTSSVKCAEVMAQVIEVIEEAVKEIEPVSTEITAAS